MSSMDLPIANLLIDYGSLAVLLLVILGISYRVKKGSLHHFSLWRVFSDRETRESKVSSQTTQSFFTILLREVFAFRVLGTCSKLKRAAHLALFWGFVSLAVSTTLAFFTNPTNLVLPLYNPVKIFGNLGGALVVVGFLAMFYVRYREKAPIWRLTRSDMFLLTLFLAVVTGFITQQTIYSSSSSDLVSSAFWIHMAFVITLLATAPFTKFFHAVSKPFSLLYQEIDRRSGVEPLLPAGQSTMHSQDKEK